MKGDVVMSVEEWPGRLVITEVITETIGGGAVHVALSPKEITQKHRKVLQRRVRKRKVGIHLISLEEI